MKLKKTVNITFLTLSISLSAYFLFFLSKSPIVKVIACTFAIMYELANRYILAAGRAEWKKKRKFNALILFIFYGAYIVYNILSGAGFFITEIATQDRLYSQVEVVQTANLQKLDQLNRTIDTLNRALEVEVETTFRSRSALIEEKLKEREVEREELLQSMIAAPAGRAEEKNPFRDLSASLGIPMNRLVGGIWCMVMAGICVILIVTGEELPEQKVQKATVTKNVTTVTPTTVKSVTPVTPKMLVKKCAVCGQTVRPDQKYCSDACKQKAYRERQKRKKTVLKNAEDSA